MQYFGNCQKAEKVQRKKIQERRILYSTSMVTDQKKSSNNIYSCLIEGHYAISLSSLMLTWVIS